jgi:purine-binding chemotaxis protein CheW
MSAPAHDAPAGTGEDRAGRHPHLLFEAAGARCALPLSRIREVVRCPAITRMPLGPEGLEGLVNLRGTVTAVVGLHHVLGAADAEPGDDARILVIEGDAPEGLLADRLLGTIRVSPAEVDPVEPDPGEGGNGTPMRRDLLAGLLPGGEGEPAILLLDVERILRGALAPGARRTCPAPAVAAPAPVPAAATRERQLVCFEVDRQDYALPIECVREIVRLPDAVSRVPHARGHHLGVVSLRGRLLPLVSLQALLGLPEAPLDRQARVVVTALDDGVPVGLVVEAVRDVLRVSDDVADAVPALFGRATGEEIEAICRLDGGRRLVPILSAGNLLRSDVLARALEEGAVRREVGREAEGEGTVHESDDGAGHDVEKFVVFRVGRESYGLPVGAVEEIVRVPDDPIHIPGAPAWLAGMMNRRGAVLSVVDMHRRFGLPGPPAAGRVHVVVANVGGTRAGLLVDAATGVLGVPARAIGPAPEFRAEHAHVVSRVARLEKGMVLLLVPDRLLSPDELGRLAGFVTDATPDGSG